MSCVRAHSGVPMPCINATLSDVMTMDRLPGIEQVTCYGACIYSVYLYRGGKVHISKFKSTTGLFRLNNSSIMQSRSDGNEATDRADPGASLPAGSTETQKQKVSLDLCE